MSTEREISKIIKSNLNVPSELGAIDYKKPAVQTSYYQGDLVKAFIKIHDLTTEQNDLQTELKQLNKQRDELEKTIGDLGDIEKKCMMLRIKGLTNCKIAHELNYSEKGIEKIFYRIRRRGQSL